MLKENWPWVALVYIGLTIMFTVWVENRINRANRWQTTLLGGLLLPTMTFIGGLAWVSVLPDADKSGGGMLFAVIAVAAIYSLPLCLLSAASTVALRRF